MEILPIYAITGILASLGLLCGFVLAKFVKEELEAGDRYFLYLKWILAITIIGLLFYYTFNVFVIVIGLIFLFILYFKQKNYLVEVEYALLGILYHLAFTIKSYEVIGLIFVYGLPAGTRYYTHKKHWLDIIVSMLIFFAVALGLFIL